MRGRDHGLAPYNDFRSFAGLGKVKFFTELREMPPEVRRKLRRVYANVDDIDAFTGGTSELPMDGALLGPTFACNFFKRKS